VNRVRLTHGVTGACDGRAQSARGTAGIENRRYAVERVRFNPWALLVAVGFFALIAMAMSSGPGTKHALEAAVTVIIALGLGGYAFRSDRRQR